MRELPIIFNTEMVKAILRGDKICTRRHLNPQPVNMPHGSYIDPYNKNLEHFTAWTNNHKMLLNCGGNIKNTAHWKPQYQTGDILNPLCEVLGYDVRYAVDTKGNIFSKNSGLWKKLKTNNFSGYTRLTLRQNNKDVNVLLHRVICNAFMGYSDLDIRHLDGDPYNNRLENLDYGSKSQNWSDKKYHGNCVKEKHHNSKITYDQAKEIRNSNLKYRELSELYGISYKTIYNIRKGITWIEYKEEPRNCPNYFKSTDIKVTGVRVERVNQINNDGCISEGIPMQQDRPRIQAFRELWNSLYKNWDDNPWVWVIDFEVIKK